MYKLLLCWRYLRTRYLAMICIVSVMLGVATLIVVNSVMSGFSTKLKNRLHGLLSDLIVESISMDGFADPDEKMRRIQESPIGVHVEAMSPTIEIFAMMQYRCGPRGELITRPVRLFGIDPVSRSRVGGFQEYLTDPNNRRQPGFEMSREARMRYDIHHPPLPMQTVVMPSRPVQPDEPPDPDPVPSEPKKPQGLIVGHAIASFRERTAQPGEPKRDVFMLEPGDDVVITTVSAGPKMMPVHDRFVITDYFKSEMSEYDSNYVFVSLEHLQHLRTMQGRANSLLIKLTPEAADNPELKREIKAELQRLFPSSTYLVNTWEDKQGPLLAAISIEKGILNVLLFLIIGVAGFGILAIFSMIVSEKTRDIGILKSLGASNSGVMSIFLSYGLLLGFVGAALGTVLGLTITYHINPIEHFVSTVTGSEVFDRSVYYFDAIPTDVQLVNVLLVNLGALAIAVLFSVLPALKAALLHPVRALRYE